MSLSLREFRPRCDKLSLREFRLRCDKLSLREFRLRCDEEYVRSAIPQFSILHYLCSIKFPIGVK